MPLWQFDIFLLKNRSDHEETRTIWSRILENVDALQEQKGLRPHWMQTYQRSEKSPSVSLFMLKVPLQTEPKECISFVVALHYLSSIWTYRIGKD